MAFIKIPGLTGKLYVPDEKPKTEKKHDCKDCFSCQNCGDDRCQLCRRERHAACSNSPETPCRTDS